MQIENYRSQFTIYTLAPEMPWGRKVQDLLYTAGYEARHFSDSKNLVEIVKQTCPHLVVIDYEYIGDSLSEVVSLLLDINSEILLAIVGPANQFGVISQYREFGLAHYIPMGEELESRILWLVDSTCESLYLKYQNEQLYEDLLKAPKSALPPPSNLPPPAVTGYKDLNSRSFSVISQIATHSEAESRDDLLQQFVHILDKNFPTLKGVYFKFLPTSQSLVATHSVGFNADDIKGVGCHLEFHEFRQFEELVKRGEAPPSFEKILAQAFKVQQYELKVLLGLNGVEGIFVFWPVNQVVEITETWAILTMCFRNFCLEKRLQQLEIYDTLTELNNRTFYYEKLQAEVARARRIERPVSVARLRVDKYDELLNSMGEVNLRVIMQNIGNVIRKTSRVNDFACRVGEGEIALILPHAPRKGAAIRAERLRRTIEQLSHSQHGIKITVSFGVSEYPSLSNSAQSLDESSLVALEHIAQRGGNKVCLFKAADNFKADFQVPPI